MKGDKKKKTSNKTALSGVSNTVNVNSATNEILRDQKITPLVTGITSNNVSDRIQALGAFPAIIRDQTCRKLLLKERIVNVLLEKTIHDSSQEVVVLGWGALRCLAEEEGYDVALHLFRKDVLKTANAAIENIKTAIQNLVTSPGSLPPAEEARLWECTENIVALMTCLCQTTEDVANAVGTQDFIIFLVRILTPSINAPAKVQTSVALCLNSMLEENEKAIQTLLTGEGNLEILRQLQNELSADFALRTVAICGVLHSIYLEVQIGGGNASSDIDLGYTNLDLAISLTDTVKAILLNTNAFGNSDTILQLALEVIASIAADAQDIDDQDDQAPSKGKPGKSKPQAEKPKTNGINASDGMDEDIDTRSDDGDEEEDSDEDLDEDMEHDMEMVIGEEGTASHINHDEIATTDSVVTYLVEQSAPAIYPLTTSTTTIKNEQTIIHAVNALNNIAWTVASILSADSKVLPPKTWEPLCQALWNECVTAALATNVASAELAEALTSLSWAISKSIRGKLDLTHSQHKTFMGVHNAAASPDFKAKCIGLLGSLAMAQGRVEINKEIGIFLIHVIDSLPTAETESVIEALNAIFDIYADKDYDYDQPVFVDCGFLNHLKACATKIKAMAKRIDKRKSKLLRDRADDASTNLGEFIKYKTNERK